MSARTRSVAVAVSAINGISGKRPRNSAICRYSGRKSCPHSLMQCASSIAISPGCHSAKRSNISGSINRSGATYSRRYSPLYRPARRRRAAAAPSVEFKNVADTPASCSASTWSFISAISGETTIVSPPLTRAGNW